MNKYSKRALKTTATVGMSLAMVLSAAAPVMATAIDPVCEASGTETECKSLFFDLATAIEKIGLDELTVDSEFELAGDDVGVIATIIINRAGLETAANGSDYTALKKWLAVTDEIATDDTVGADAKGMFSTAYFTDDEHVATVGGLVNYYNTQLTNSGNWTSGNIGTSTNAENAVKAFEKMNKWIEDGHYDRLNDALATVFDDVYDLLETATADYVVDDADVTRVFVAAWTTVLEQDLSEAGKIKFSEKDLAAFEKETKYTSGTTPTIDLKSKTAIKGRIDDIKNAPNYYRVKNDSDVMDLIEQYNDLLGNIADLKDLLKDASYKAYGSTKTDSKDATVKSILVGFDYKKSAALDKAKELAAKLDLEQYEIIKALKEDVLDYAYNFETKKIGNYYVDKSGPVSGFNGDGAVKRDLGNSAFLLDLVDNKEGLFGFDVIANHMEAVATAYNAVTKDIEKLTPANIKASDKVKLEAAEDAYYELAYDDGKYDGNLTKDQNRELRRVATKIENLREAFDNLGTTTATGWYDKGAGNWGYNNEDGTPATKWVAAGSDWYYVKGGNMLRNAWIAENASGARWYYVNDKGVMVTNTVVDGYTIDANGIWTK